MKNSHNTDSDNTFFIAVVVILYFLALTFIAYYKPKVEEFYEDDFDIESCRSCRENLDYHTFISSSHQPRVSYLSQNYRDYENLAIREEQYRRKSLAHENPPPMYSSL